MWINLDHIRDSQDATLGSILEPYVKLLLCSASSYFSSDRHVTMQGRSAMSLSFLVQVSARIWLHRWLLAWYTLWIDDTLSFAFERRINQSDDQCLSIFDIYFIHVILIICYTSVVYYTSLSINVYQSNGTKITTVTIHDRSMSTLPKFVGQGLLCHGHNSSIESRSAPNRGDNRDTNVSPWDAKMGNDWGVESCREIIGICNKHCSHPICIQRSPCSQVFNLGVLCS